MRSASSVVLSGTVLAVLAAGAVAQSTWVNAAPMQQPSPRCCAGLASDLTGRLWLFGGGSSPGILGETWEWNGTTWLQHLPAVEPTPRYGLAMVFDLMRSRVVLFGGNTTAGLSGETWEWDGASWLLRVPPSSPPARYEHAMAFDLLRGRTVLYGGSTGAAETWEWDGTTWTQFTGTPNPGSRRGHAMAFLTAAGKTVLFGGTSAQTWEFDGTAWVQRLPATSPPSRIYFSMCEDLVRGRVVLFSGRPTYANDTWEYDGSEWTQRQPVAAPTGRAATMMAFDAGAGQPLLFGGNFLSSPTAVFAETWRLRASSATFTAYGSGCAGTVGVPQLGAVGSPWLGTNWSVRLSNVPATAPVVFAAGFSSGAWVGGPLPFSLAGFGMPGCDLHVSAEATTFTTAVNGTATLTLGIPSTLSLAGVSVFFQGLALDPGANAGGAVVSNGGQAVVAGL